MPYLGLSRRALRDIAEIESYSIEQWGEEVTAEYLQSIVIQEAEVLYQAYLKK